MVRTSGGIRISAGKSSKKGGGGSHSSAPSTPSGKTSSKGSSRLPPIPHCEAPSWQKPITNFFNAGASSSKDEPQVKEQPEENLKDIEISDRDGIKKDKDVTEKKIEHLNNTTDDEPQSKKQKEEQDKENEDNNI